MSELAAVAVSALPRGRVTGDRPCLNCRYNLRTLATDARCPECGYAVALTLFGGLPLVDTRGRRLRLAAACGALVLAMLSPFFEESWAPVQGNQGPGAWWDPAWGYVPIAVAAALAMLLFSLPQHRADGLPMFRGMRRLILATAPACPLALVAWEYAYAWAPASDFARDRQLIHVPLLGVAPGILLCFRLLARLAGPLGAPGYARLLRIMTFVWWPIVIITTFALLDYVPALQATSQTYWHRAKLLVGPLSTPLIVAGEVVVLVGFVGGLGLLAFFAAELAVSKPRNPLKHVNVETADAAAAAANGQSVR